MEPFSHEHSVPFKGYITVGVKQGDSLAPVLFYAMRSMRGGFISRSRGPLQKVCHDPARMSGHDCLPGPQTVCFPRGRPHEQNEEVPLMDGSAGRTHTMRTAHMCSLTPQTTTPVCRERTPPTVGDALGPCGCSAPLVERIPLVVSINQPWGRPARNM